jgi:lysophospholipase L1-like esterase
LRKYIKILVLLFFTVKLCAQDSGYLYHINPYNFIREDINGMYNHGDNRFTETFFKKTETLLRTGEGRINIVHIGGSHIQAGTFSGQIRNRLQQLNGEMNAGYGFMFPYRISRTNTPFGYYIRYSGNWQSCRNVETRKNDLLGVGGISVSTMSPETDLTIILEKDNNLDYRFNRIKVFCNYETSGFMVSIDSSIMNSKVEGDGFIEFILNAKTDSLQIKIRKNGNSSKAFALYGMVTESAKNGFLYHSIGVNGAHVPAFLRCQLLEEQLAQLKPDLVILGLGINDAYTQKFNQKQYEDNYAELISRIRKAAPGTAIILTTNNDSYLFRRYVNSNGEKVRESMLKLADKYNTGVWDMYSVMGGLNSVVLWEKSKLAQNDRIHFTREGYLLLGDLFFAALMQDFEKYIQGKNKQTLLTN